MVMGEPQSTMSRRWDPLDGPHVETCVCSSGSPAGHGGELGCCVGNCPLAQPRVPGGCLSPERPDPARSRALKMAASAGPGTAVPWGGGAPCPGARAGGSQGCCASTAQGTPLAPPHPVAVSSRFPRRPGPRSQLPVPSREIINGVMVTDRDNNELGHSRVSLRMGVRVLGHGVAGAHLLLLLAEGGCEGHCTGCGLQDHHGGTGHE